MATSATATLAAAIVGNTAALAQPGQPQIEKWLLEFDFSFDPRTLDQGGATPPTAPAVGPIYLAGQIWDGGGLNPDGTPKSDAVLRGTHRFFGWLYEPAAMTVIGTHTFDIAGRGKIVVAGATDGLNAPVAGGTGDFKTAYGELRVGIINRAAAAYHAVFDMLSPTIGR